jgi:hypothetical protein
MKIDAVGIGAYLESSKLKPITSKEVFQQEDQSEIKQTSKDKVAKDKIELSYSQSNLIELLSSEEKEFMEKLFGYEQKIRSLSKDLKVYSNGRAQDKNILGTKIDIIA